MKKLYVLFIATFLLSTFSFAQSTYTLTANTAGWDGGDLTNFNLTVGDGTAPITYIIPDGLSLTTLFNGAMLFPANSTFEVHGTFSYRGDTPHSMTVIADGTSDGTADVVMGLGSSMDDLDLSFVNVTASAGVLFPAVGGNLTVSDDAGTTLAKTTSFMVSGNATFNLAKANLTQSRPISGKMTANVAGGKFISTTTAGSFTANVTAGELDLGGTITGTAGINVSGTGITKLSSIVNSKFSGSAAAGGTLDLDGARLKFASRLTLTGTGKVNLKNGVTFDTDLTTRLDPDSEMRFNETTTIGGKGTFDVEGKMFLEGQLDMTDQTSKVSLLAGSSLEMTTALSRLKMGTTSKVGMHSFAGPLVMEASSLPIELMEFKAQMTDDGIVVQWTTLTERDVDYYEIIRSTNGRDYEVVSSFRDIGDSYEVKNYSFTDRAIPPTGTVYYQLKNIDLDGTFDFSEIISVNMEDEFADIEIFPNPVAERLTIESKEDGVATIYDVQGRNVFQMDFGKGRNQIDVSQLPGGVYSLSFIGASSQVYTKQIIVASK